MRTSLLVVGSVSATLVAGCASGPQQTSNLATWSKAKLAMSLDYDPPTSTNLVSVTATLDNDFLADGSRAGFPPLGADIRATLDGVPMTVVGRGENGGFPVFRRNAGNSFPSATAASTTLVLTDASGSVTMTVESFYAPRTIALTAPAGGAIHAGDNVSIAWSPSTDVLNPLLVKLIGASGQCGKIVVPAGSSTLDPTYDDPGLAVSGATIDFPVPADWSCTGPGYVEPSMGVIAGITTCTGVGACVGNLPDQLMPDKVTVTVQ
jgi:hypothetical protein